MLFAPTESCSLLSSAETKNYLIVSALEDVLGELRFWRYDKAAASWSLERTFQGEGFASPSASAVSAEESDAIWLTSSSYTEPTTLAIAEAAAPADQERLKSLPAFYEAAGLQTQQLFATSADGTRVPYFIISREDAPLDGSTPALLYGYGGFEISLTPGYAATVGAAWLEKGYAYVQVRLPCGVCAACMQRACSGVRAAGVQRRACSVHAACMQRVCSGCAAGVRRARHVMCMQCIRCAGQHPRRWRVRPALAPGRAQGESQQGAP